VYILLYLGKGNSGAKEQKGDLGNMDDDLSTNSHYDTLREGVALLFFRLIFT